jgi:hypothetical protein
MILAGVCVLLLVGGIVFHHGHRPGFPQVALTSRPYAWISQIRDSFP